MEIYANDHKWCHRPGEVEPGCLQIHANPSQPGHLCGNLCRFALISCRFTHIYANVNMSYDIIVTVWLTGGHISALSEGWEAVSGCLHVNLYKHTEFVRFFQIYVNLCNYMQIWPLASSHCDGWLRRRGKCMQIYTRVCPVHAILFSLGNWTGLCKLCKRPQMMSLAWQPEIQVLWCLGGRAWLHANPNQVWEICGNSCRSALISG